MTFGGHVLLPRDRRAYFRNKERARALISELLGRCNVHYGFPIRRIAVKDLRRNWGSCSEKGNLNFNYKIVYLPILLAEYLVVHELCHLGRFDHSPEFWSLVSRLVPDHPERRRALSRFHP
jgi:predicted metal-dependent hydrolase